MAVLVDQNTKIIVQGITGTQASFHVQRAIKHGTNIVAGVVPNKKEDFHLGVPVFSTVREAKEKTGASASLVFVPAKSAKSAILEAIHAGMDLIVVITSGIPVNDMMEVRHELAKTGALLIGPNTPGIITPKQAYIGIFPDNIHQSGDIGIISRSSTLTYEVVLEMNRAGFGESTVVGLGDDFIIGTGFTELIKKFNQDDNTKAVVLIGGIDGNYETEVAELYAKMPNIKPIIALMIEDTTPISKDTGLAPDILYRGITTAEEKKKRLEESGMIVVDNLADLVVELSKL